MKLLQDLTQIPAGITIIGFDPNRSSIMMSTIDLFSTKGITTFWCSPESDFLCGMFNPTWGRIVELLDSVDL